MLAVMTQENAVQTARVAVVTGGSRELGRAFTISLVRRGWQAFPGEDISDRPSPERVVPALLALAEADLPSGRYRAAELMVEIGR